MILRISCTIFIYFNVPAPKRISMVIHRSNRNVGKKAESRGKFYTLLKNGEFIQSSMSGKYAGYAHEKIFGRLDCRSGKRMMKKENRVFFHSLEDAVREGYRPCKNCRPLSEDEFEDIRYLVPQYHTLDDFYHSY